MGDYLDNLKAIRKMYEDSLVKLQNELDDARRKYRRGTDIRRLGRFHMGQDVGDNPPSGARYLENLEFITIPGLVNRIYIANNNIERLTSEIESLEPVAVPVAEDVEYHSQEVSTTVGPGNLRSSSSSSDGDGKKKRRKSRRRKSRRRKSRRRKSHKHHSKRRNKRKLKKNH